MKESAKQAGLGAGLFSAAGVLGLFGFGTAIATAIIALALALPWWLSALIMTVVLFVAAVVAGVLGRRHVQQVSPKPERAIENVKRDVQEVKESAQHDHTH
jgi:tetrahydromethanopterin S-methyltransferase subunit C